MAVDPSAETEAERPGALARGLEPNTMLGKYRLERVLGAGGMGVVWAATDPDLDRAVAIKLLRAADGSETQRTRLLREARAMARLKHPNVLTVYEVGTAAGVDYIVMELVDGTNLGEWLATKPPPARPGVIAALLAAGRGLTAAHAAGIVHRDFKPENVLRGRSGHVFVTDFGLAFGHVSDGAELVPLPVAHDALSGSIPASSAERPARRPLDSVLDSPLTQTGVLIGTPAYMAPEQFAGKPAGPRSDQFAFCVTAWEALTGERPFRGANLDQLRAAAAGGVGSARTALASRVQTVLARGLAPDPEQRWPDMQALLRALEQALQPAQPRRPLVIATVAAAAMLAGGITVWSLRNRTHSDGATCEPADVVFAPAWGPARRAAVKKAHSGGESIAAFAILDETRKRWVRAYEATCAAPPSAARHEQLACLLEARDELVAETKPLESPDAELDITDLVSVTASVEACTRGGLPVPPAPPDPPAP
jgi:serine/threonine protein kinase